MALRRNSFDVSGVTYVETIDPVKDFVIVKDQGEAVVLDVNKGCVSVNDVRKCLGFDYIYGEPFSYQDNVSLLVTDYAIKIIKTFKDHREMRQFFLDQEINQFKAKDYLYLRDRSSKDGIYQSFLRGLKDQELEELQSISLNYLEIYKILDRNFDGVDSLVQIYHDLEGKILSIASRNKVELPSILSIPDEKEHISEDEEHIESEIREPIDVYEVIAEVRAKKVASNLDKFLDTLKKEEKYVEWEDVDLRGVLLDTSRGELRPFWSSTPVNFT